MEVNEGYLNTELGAFPIDWVGMKLKDISMFITKGATPTTYGFKWESSGILFLRSECVTNDGLDLSQSMFISERAHKALIRGEIKACDILITITGNVGRVICLNKSFGNGNINQHIARIRINNDNIDNLYTYHFLSQKIIRKYFESIVTGQAYPQISLVQVRDATVYFPNDKTEQTLIANALSDTDALIENLEKLIVKKRNIKQGTMQELLTGKKRLAGFKGKWEVTKLGNYIRFHVGFPFSSLYFNQKEDGLRLIKNRDLKSNDQVFYYSGDYPKEFLVHDGDILVGMDGDFLLCRWTKGLALLNQRVGRIVKSGDINLIFLYFYTQKYLTAIQEITASTTVKHLSHSDIENIVLPLPNLGEQNAIANILIDMDTEIEALKQKLHKYRMIKHGMMQVLLTGKIRLI